MSGGVEEWAFNVPWSTILQLGYTPYSTSRATMPGRLDYEYTNPIREFRIRL